MHDPADSLEIESSAGDVGANQSALGVFVESVVSLFPVGVLHVAMQLVNIAPEDVAGGVGARVTSLAALVDAVVPV
jgi:hypothetical protein